MESFALILLGTVLVNNFVLVQFLGLCPFMGVSNRIETSIGLSIATTFVLTLASVCSYLIEHWLLQPLGIPFLRIVAFIFAIAVVVQGTEVLLRRSSPLLYQLLGLYLPLITTNCAVLGVALLNVNAAHSFAESLAYGFGAAIGFSMVLVLFAAIRTRLELADVPGPFKGSAIGLITAGIMSLAFMGFTGMIRY